MPRITKLQKLKNEAKDKLNEVRSLLSGKTYNSFLNKIDDKDRPTSIKKIMENIKEIKDLYGSKAQKLTLAKIKETKEKVRKIKQTKKDLLKANLAKFFEPKNVLIKKRLQDKVKFYTKYSYSYIGVDTLEDFYNNIKTELDKKNEGQSFTSVSIFTRNKESGNKVRAFSMLATEIRTYEDFINRLEQLRQGSLETTGSDPLDYNDEDEIILTNFALSQTRIEKAKIGNGTSNTMLFETVGIEESKSVNKKNKKEVGNKDCAYQCLKYCGVDFKGDINEIRSVDNLIKYIKSNNLPISVLCNSFTLKRFILDMIKDYGEIDKYINDKKGFPRLNPVFKFNIGVDVELCHFYEYNPHIKYDKYGKQDIEFDDYTDKELEEIDDKSYEHHTIIFDEFNNHFDVIKNDEIKLCDDVYLDRCMRVIKNDKHIFSPRQININSKADATIVVETRFVIFDYETVIDFDKSSCMQEYSLSILDLSDKELEKLTTADEEEDLDTINTIRKQRCVTFLGYDCSTKFINWILDNQSDKAFVFIGFNNANFDNFILLDALLRHNLNNVESDFSISDIFYNGSQLLNFHMCGRHNTFDIHKHLMGSLKANCDSFKIKCCAKKSFDHNKAQLLHSENKLIDFINDNEELKEYNEYDVLATAVLFCKYRRALSNIEATHNYAKDLHNIKTVGSLIYKVFEESKLKKGFELPKLSYEQYDNLQKSKIAGRVELFNGVQKVEERLVSTDVCSLYPYVMAVLNCYYPCGKTLIDVDEYKGDDVIGFYYCDIDQSNLRSMNLPNIYAHKTKIENDWSYTGILENYLISNVMIGLLRKYGCKVEIKNGFVFPDKKKSCDMFDFLLDFMKAKNEQDTLKKNKDSNYNSALRETLKLLMNSLSGKVIEGLHTEQTRNVESIAEYEKIKEKSTSINFINAIGNKLFITYDVDPEKICKKSQRPIYLGVLIYDYAKRYMFENSYSKVGLDQLLYTDTDASKFRYKRFLEWKDWVDKENIQVPHWEEVELIDERYKNHKIFESNSKVFGSFEDELEEMKGDKYTFYCLEKKSWLYDVDGHSKYRFKGLNGNAQILTLQEDFIKSRQINHKEKDDKPAWIETKYYTEVDCEEKIHNFYTSNISNAIDSGNEAKFFEQIYSTGEAYVLCNSFRKIVKNSAHKVELGNEEKYNNLMNRVQVNYMMKHINLNKK